MLPASSAEADRRTSVVLLRNQRAGSLAASRSVPDWEGIASLNGKVVADLRGDAQPSTGSRSESLGRVDRGSWSSLDPRDDPLLDASRVAASHDTGGRLAGDTPACMARSRLGRVARRPLVPVVPSPGREEPSTRH